MEYLAIRDEENKNVYYYNTKGEKGRILSKFPNASNRVFAEEDKEEAMSWAGVDRIATEEENQWATTKIKKDAIETPSVPVNDNKEVEKVDAIESKPEIDNIIDNASKPEVVDKPIKTTKQNETEDATEKVVESQAVDNYVDVSGKHIASDFEKVIELYKKSGVKVVDILLKNGTTIVLLVDDLYYISNLNGGEFDNVLSSYTEQSLRDEILRRVETRKQNGEKGAIFNQHINFEMFDKIQKTKYLAFGDLVYIANGSNIIQKIEPSLVRYEIGDDVRCKHITFSTTNISTILPHNLSNYSFIAREKEFTTYLKRTLKQIEKQKEKEKLEKAEQNKNA